MTWPELVVSAPLGGPQGRRAAPLLAALAALTRCRFILGAASERDLAPGRSLTFANWLDSSELDEVPHLHILADDAAAIHALRAALHRPGATLLQDPGLSLTWQAMTLDAGQPEAWVRAMAAAHGGAGRRLARAQLAGGLFCAAQRQRLPMLDALADAAPLLIVRSQHAATFLPAGARRHVLPEPFPPPAALGQAAARSALGLGEGALLLVPLRAPAALGALREVAAQAGAALLPCLPADDVALHAAACDAALALSLPFGTTPLHPLAAALATGRPVLAWEADPAAGLGARTVEFPADGASLAEAIRHVLSEGDAPRAAGPGVMEEARALLGLVSGCRCAAPAP